MSSSGSGQPVDISTLSAAQLSQLKKQLDTELEHLTSSFQQLRTAQSKFKDCLKSIAAVSAQKETSQPHLIPLTSSLYVPGHFAHLAPKSASDDDDEDDIEEEDSAASKEPSFLVDVGTGFFTTHNPSSATDFYNRKVSELETNLKDLEGIINGKGQSLRVVENVLAQKVLATQQGGEGKSE